MATANIQTGPPVSGIFEANVVDSGAQPTNVVRRNETWSVDCTWYVEGGLASSLGGSWELSVALEALGPGPETVTSSMPIPLDGRTGPANRYAGSVSFPANTMDLQGLQKVPFRVVALLNYDDQAGAPGPIAASIDLGVVTVFA